nr:IS110 family transposase [Candidatus Dependentiae bacterium]
ENNYCYGRVADLEIEPFEFKHNETGYKRILNNIIQLQKASCIDKVIIGCESTGVYGEPFVHYFQLKGFEVVLVNPMHTKRVKEMNDNSPNKTDKKDPKVIADIIELGNILKVVVPEGSAADLRRLTELRETYIQYRTSLYNQIHSKVFLVFPEYFEVLKDIKTKCSHYVLYKYTLPQHLRKLSSKKLGMNLQKISRGRKNESTAKMLIEKAGSSVGISAGSEIIAMDIRQKLDMITNINIKIMDIEKLMEKTVERIDYSKNILSIRGIKTVLVAGIIGELGDIKKFKTTSEIEKFAGLDLFEISSGKQKGNCHISKRGRSHLRKILYQCALNVIRKGGIMHEVYNNYLDRNKPKMKAIVAIMRKLLRLIFALVRDNKSYLDNYTDAEIAA